MSEVLVIGGGVFGLWCARACLALGLDTVLAERGALGAGASATPVGALAPHEPGPPAAQTALKALQLDGLAALPAEIAALEAETGLATGYVRCGRVRPLADAAARARAAAQAGHAAALWRGLGEVRLHERVPARLAGLVAAAAAPAGIAEDTLTARIDPPRYLAALAAAVRRRGRVLEGWHCRGLEPGAARFDRGRLAARHIVVAAGWESLALAGLAPPRGVKGQAAVLGVRLDPGLPLVGAPGLYIVGHAGGTAVGATSEHDWVSEGPDSALDAVIARARAVSPALAGAPVLRRWAGIRPRAPGPGPIAGALPGAPEILLAAGGYKIGFALAHLVGRALAAAIAGWTPAIRLPEIAHPAAHLGSLPD
ncbi:FAD-binding oxidoreductase [Paralimibaculum aggregatum]|uniref:FAD-binding oxidoreductase n=1 Tax=Paralimibaculum aggregatum TaxID=3036245 RepID=A0ABQ6LSK6_9RHOB|nr:FAD-binding oxidoreductase [Limibaculum sp. NKW23]GMG85063.1 FAD-binding oxidoreductase [Limibaculum sp. NKW23]